MQQKSRSNFNLRKLAPEKLRLRQLIPIGVLCSIGMTGLIHGSAYAATPSAEISVGDMIGKNIVSPTTERTRNFFAVPISITVHNALSYTISLFADNANLTTGAEGAREIEAISSASSLDDMPDNHWGYRYTFGDEAKEDKTSSYKAIPSREIDADVVNNLTYNGRPTTSVVHNDSGTETKYLTIGYGTTITSDFPAGNYKNKVTVSIVMQPRDTASIFTISDMQDMMSSICSNTTTPANDAELYDDDGSHTGDDRYIPRTMLKDMRDDHWYIVEKLADGNCWMTENLALSSGTTEATRRTITSADSNVTSDYKLPISSTSGFSNATVQNMYNGEETAGVDANYGFNYNTLTAAQKTTKIESLYNTTSHTGGYYSWLTAVAGNKGGASSSGQQATEDICPKGWQLPTGEPTTGDFTKLYVKYGSNKTNFNQVWHIVDNNSYVGVYDSSALNNSTANMLWWSRTSGSDIYAYYLHDAVNGDINPSYANRRTLGLSLRCLAKQ